MKLAENRNQLILESLLSVRHYDYLFASESLPSTWISSFSGTKKKNSQNSHPMYSECILKYHWGIIGAFLNTLNSTLSTAFSIVSLHLILYIVTLTPSVPQSTAHISMQNKPLLKFRV